MFLVPTSFAVLVAAMIISKDVCKKQLYLTLTKVIRLLLSTIDI